MPVSAAAAATAIFPISAAAGKNSDISSRPSAALWLAPTIEGSTKRLRIRICIIIPATAIDAPVNTRADVRGRRLTSMSRMSSDSERTCRQLKSATPTERLTIKSTASASRFDRLK